MQGILITARLGSTRLQGKHLKQVDGKPIIHYLLERINHQFKKEISSGRVKVIIATSAEKQNTPLRSFQSLAEPFFGDVKNIPLRHLQAALTYNLDSIIAVDGDDILCSPDAIRAVQEQLKNGKTYVTTKGLPFGLNAFGYATDFLSESLDGNKDKILETGWGRIFEFRQPKEIRFPGVDEHKDTLRFTLDYEDDLSFFTALIDQLGDEINTISDQSLIDFVMREELYELNKNRIKEYWENFENQRNHHG